MRVQTKRNNAISGARVKAIVPIVILRLGSAPDLPPVLGLRLACGNTLALLALAVCVD